ncbi:hypothetical protein GIB67_037190, partial [Kingdonia uniflora]
MKSEVTACLISIQLQSAGIPWTRYRYSIMYTEIVGPQTAHASYDEGTSPIVYQLSRIRHFTMLGDCFENEVLDFEF